MESSAYSDASYLSVPNARSRAGRHFFASSDSKMPQNNGAIFITANVIKHVMASVTEAESAALYIIAWEAVYICIVLEEMCHKKPHIPLGTENDMADAVVNSKVQPKQQRRMVGENTSNNSEFVGSEVKWTMWTIGQAPCRNTSYKRQIRIFNTIYSSQKSETRANQSRGRCRIRASMRVHMQ